jgi:hypothetical protein
MWSPGGPTWSMLSLEETPAAATSPQSLLGLVGRYSVDRGATYAERRGDGIRRFPAGVHPTNQSGLRCVKSFGSANRLTARPPRLPRCGSTFATQLQLKLGQEGLLLENFWPRVKKSATGRRSRDVGVALRISRGGRYPAGGVNCGAASKPARCRYARPGCDRFRVAHARCAAADSRRAGRAESLKQIEARQTAWKVCSTR